MTAVFLFIYLLKKERMTAWSSSSVYNQIRVLVLVLVEEEIFLCRIIRPDVFDTLVDLSVILKFLKILHYLFGRT